MIENQTITEAIQKRYSCRTYTGSAIDPGTRQRLDAFVLENTKSPFGSRMRFKLITATPENTKALKGLGTYGMIKGASGFIIGAVEKAPQDLEDYGYAMEAIILYATQLGIGTCWLGGTFAKSVFAKKISAGTHETVPAVVATGNIAPKKRLTEKIVRWGARASTRKPWSSLFFHENFETPIESEEAGEYQTPLEMIRIAPSASNNQPWRVVRDKTAFHFFLQRTNGYFERNNKYFGMADMQRIDMGIAMCHFELACRELNLGGEWISRAPDIQITAPQTTYVTSWGV
ncbi:MAG: nitroreductase [Proteobacteria bacterium]|nr:nitroreductase [Pseudomonadota bacterium]